MKNINTRKWSTPVVIGAGLFVSISGVLMFAGVRNPVEQAHEWIGLVFAIAIIFHVLNHWMLFKSYFTQRYALTIVGSVAIATFVFIIVSASKGNSNLMRSVVHSFEEASLAEVAPLLDQKTKNIIKKFEANGFIVKGPEDTIKEMATNNNVEPKVLMQVLFN